MLCLFFYYYGLSVQAMLDCIYFPLSFMPSWFFTSCSFYSYLLNRLIPTCLVRGRRDSSSLWNHPWPPVSHWEPFSPFEVTLSHLVNISSLQERAHIKSSEQLRVLQPKIVHELAHLDIWTWHVFCFLYIYMAVVSSVTIVLKILSNI